MAAGRGRASRPSRCGSVRAWTWPRRCFADRGGGRVGALTLGAPCRHLIGCASAIHRSRVSCSPAEAARPVPRRLAAHGCLARDAVSTLPLRIAVAPNRANGQGADVCTPAPRHPPSAADASHGSSAYCFNSSSRSSISGLLRVQGTPACRSVPAPACPAAVPSGLNHMPASTGPTSRLRIYRRIVLLPGSWSCSAVQEHACDRAPVHEAGNHTDLPHMRTTMSASNPCRMPTRPRS